MKPPEKCIDCKIRLILGWEQRGEQTVRKIAMCPKCKISYVGKDVYGEMEVERECFSLKFIWKNFYPEKEEILKVKQIDPDLQNQSIASVYHKLKPLTSWQTKPLDHFHASNIFQQAKELGLIVYWVYIEDTNSSSPTIFLDDWQ